MGTRHMIVIKQDGDFKVANYGQWDGYPMGQGIELLKRLCLIDMKEFRKAVKKCTVVTDAEIEAIPDTPDWAEKYPWLSRDAGAKIIDHILAGHHALKFNQICLEPNIYIEWTYLIDLDENLFQIYRPVLLKKNGKWAKPWAEYHLDVLPSLQVWKDRYKRY